MNASPPGSGRVPRILLAVTSSRSLILMRGLPARLAADGWDVHVVSASGPEQADLVGLSGVTIHTVDMARNASPLSDLVALGRWIRLLARIRPDVVSVGTPKAGLLGGVAAFLTRVPRRVYVLRGLRLETVTGPARLVLAFLERVSAGSSHVVLAVGHSLAREAIALRLAPAFWAREARTASTSRTSDRTRSAANGCRRFGATSSWSRACPSSGSWGA
jgi:hypothetical protein